MKKVTLVNIIIVVSVIIIVFGNVAFFKNVLELYPLNIKNGLFLLSLPVVFGGTIIFLLSLVCYRYTVKPVLILVFMLSSLAAYFMDTYNVIIDDVMINSTLSTNTSEFMDLLSIKQILYLFFLGVVPSIFVYKADIIYGSYQKGIISRVKLLAFSLVTVVSIILILSDFYASFFREHKILRCYANPTYYIYSAFKYYGKKVKSEKMPLRIIAADAVIPSLDVDRELIVLVVGETARADHFSLNGYEKKTNPYLEKKEVVSFTNFWSCGTSTAISVPCMFSLSDRSNYDEIQSRATENVLDILQNVNVNVLWLDNNSDSKHVADRVPYKSYKSSKINSICDVECRDVGMLTDLQSYIDSHPDGDIFIVLHQMGNHGPAYYKRYPAEFEKFTPTCQTNQLEDCSEEEIINAYDNAILYTDYFLSKVIALLEKNDGDFETAMLYVSDHGESLGENGLYLHGLPYIIAPDVQKHVPVVMWFGHSILHEVNIEALKDNIDTEYSHDNLFHTVLGLMEVKTSVYDESMDLIKQIENE